MLVLDGVTKAFGKSVAVSGVSISVPDGQFVGIIGGPAPASRRRCG